MNVAKMIRQAKEKEAWMPAGAPRTYCRAPDCLFRIYTRRQGYVPCPRHPHVNPECEGVSRHCTGAAETESPSREASTPVGSPAPLLAPVGLPDSRPHPADCDCPKCVMPF